MEHPVQLHLGSHFALIDIKRESTSCPQFLVNLQNNEQRAANRAIQADNMCSTVLDFLFYMFRVLCTVQGLDLGPSDLKYTYRQMSPVCKVGI